MSSASLSKWSGFHRLLTERKFQHMSETKRLLSSLFTLVCVVGCFVLLTGCGGGGSNDDSTPAYKLGDSVTLSVGDSLLADTNVIGDPVRFVISEVQDRRCPEGGICSSPSVLSVTASLSGAGAAVETFTLFNLLPPTEIPASGNRPTYRVAVTDVKPAVRTAKQIAQNEFRMTVTIERVP